VVLPVKIMEVRTMAESQALNLITRTFHEAAYVELRQSFSTQIQAISPFVDQLMRFIQDFRKSDGSEIDIATALCEALGNAVIHGNGENSRMRVHVDCRCYLDGEVSITVRAGGRGFDPHTVPDPTRPEDLLSPHGRGIQLMKTLMDEVSFEENGTVVHMRKKSNVALPSPRQNACTKCFAVGKEK
jgi:serine/threonine-protein kinase RsbW